MPPVDLNFYHCSRAVVDEQLCPHLHGAVVFLDDAFAEIIHWHGGATTLFNVGAQDIREFSSFESGSANQTKGVFCISTVFSSEVIETIVAVINASNFRDVVVISTIRSPMHSVIDFGPNNIADDDTRAFAMYRNQILEHMQQKTSERCSVKIVDLPLVMAPILPSFFTLPSFGSFFPLLPTDVDDNQRRQLKGSVIPGTSNDIDFLSLPQKLQLRFKLLACALDSMLEVLGCSEDVFALGSTSSIVAAELASLNWGKTKMRRKNTAKASLLLVDRTLDLASAVGHFHDTILDKMAAVLPHLPRHQTDVVVDMLPICMVTGNEEFRVIAPGCLAHPDDPVAVSLLNVLGMLKHKEALTEINRLVSDAAVKESLVDKASLTASRPGKSVGVDVIETQLAGFRGKAGSVRRHCGLLQLTLATTQLLRSPRLPTFDSLLAEEKGLLQCLGDDEEPNPCSQINKTLRRQLEQSPDDRIRSIDDILLLLAFVFSLAGDDRCASQAEIEELKTILYDEAMHKSVDESSDVFRQLVGKNADEIKTSKAIHGALEKLRNLSRSRSGMKRYREVYEPGSISSQARLKPLLRQVIDDIVDPSRPELTDVLHKSAGFGDLLKSGFGLFRSVSKPRPGDQPLLIVFVIGGATTTEVRQIRDAFAASKTNLQVVVGSTALVTPNDIIRRVLLQDNLHPSTDLI